MSSEASRIRPFVLAAGVAPPSGPYVLLPSAVTAGTRRCTVVFATPASARGRATMALLLPGSRAPVVRDLRDFSAGDPVRVRDSTGQEVLWTSVTCFLNLYVTSAEAKAARAPLHRRPLPAHSGLPRGSMEPNEEAGLTLSTGGPGVAAVHAETGSTTEESDNSGGGQDGGQVQHQAATSLEGAASSVMHRQPQEPILTGKTGVVLEEYSEQLESALARLRDALVRNENELQLRLRTKRQDGSKIFFQWRSVLPLFVSFACVEDSGLRAANERALGEWLTRRCGKTQATPLFRSKNTGILIVRSESLTVKGLSCMICTVSHATAVRSFEIAGCSIPLCLASADDGRCNGCARLAKGFFGGAAAEFDARAANVSTEARRSWAVHMLRMRVDMVRWRMVFFPWADDGFCWRCGAVSTKTVRCFEYMSSAAKVPSCAKCHQSIQESVAASPGSLDEMHDDDGLLKVGALAIVRGLVFHDA